MIMMKLIYTGGQSEKGDITAVKTLIYKKTSNKLKGNSRGGSIVYWEISTHDIRFVRGFHSYAAVRIIRRRNPLAFSCNGSG